MLAARLQSEEVTQIPQGEEGEEGVSVEPPNPVFTHAAALPRISRTPHDGLRRPSRRHDAASDAHPESDDINTKVT